PGSTASSPSSTGSSPSSTASSTSGGTRSAPGNTSAETPPPGLVVVPDLRGLSAPDAMTALTGAQLRLADPGATEGVVRSQDPRAGAQVPVGTPVAVVLRSAVTPETTAASSSFPALLIGAALALLVLGVLAGEVVHVRRSRRARRERQWVDDRVSFRLGDPRSPRQFTHVSDGSGPGFAVRLDVRHRSGAPGVQEVSHAHD
ncbi:MAG TPA: PASTA domain-containing protein, partial [Blastococcus sp.]